MIPADVAGDREAFRAVKARIAETSTLNSDDAEALALAIVSRYISARRRSLGDATRYKRIVEPDNVDHVVKLHLAGMPVC